MKKLFNTENSAKINMGWEVIGIALIIIWFAILCYHANLVYPWNLQVLKKAFSFSQFGKLQPELFFSHWINTFKLVALLVGYLLGALGNGLFVIDKLFPAERPRLEKGLLSVTLGFVLLILLTFFLGIFGGYHTPIYLAIYLIYVSWGIWNVYKKWPGLKPTASNWFWGQKKVLSDRILGIVIVLIVVLEYFAANVPECFWDPLLFHLAVPSQYIAHGGIHAIPGNLFSNMPMAIEMLYTGALMLGDERLCKMLHVSFGVLAAFAVFAYGRRWFGRRNGYWSAGIFLTIPFVIMSSVVSNIDLGAAFFAAMAFSEIIKTTLSKEVMMKDIWLSGVLTGAALSCKYTTALLLAPSVFVWIFVRFQKKEEIKALIYQLLIFSAGTIICLLPWLIKNTIYVQNPVFPFLYQIFHNPSIDVGKMHAQMAEFTDFGFNSWREYFGAPWDLTFRKPSGNYFIGPLFLYLLPGLFWLGIKARKAKLEQNILMAIAIMAILIWSLQTRVIRYLLPGLLPLIILYSQMIGETEKFTVCFGKLVRWSTLVFIIWGVSNAVTYYKFTNQDTVKVSLGLLSRSEYIKRNMMTEYYSMAEKINQLPGEVKVYAFGESRSYYIEKPVTSVNSHDTNILLVWLGKSTSAEDVWKKLRQEKYTHIYVHAQEAVRTRSHETHQWTSQEVKRWNELLARYAKPIVVIQQQTLYEILNTPDRNIPVKDEKPLFTYNPEIVDLVNPMADQALRLTQQGNWQGAEMKWKKIIESAPGWNAPYVVLASMYQRQNRNAEALHMYESADRLTNLNPETYHDMGVLYWSMGKPVEAINAMKQALRVNPQFEIAKKNLESMEKMYQMKNIK